MRRLLITNLSHMRRSDCNLPLRLFPFSHYLVNNFLLKTRGAKDFAGRIASHFGSVVATGSPEPIGNQFCKSPPLKWLQRWRRVLSPDVIKPLICIILDHV